MEAAHIYCYEKVQVVNVNNGARLETYVIPGRRGSGEVVLNGAAARWGEVGDPVIIFSYAQLEEQELESFEPRIIWVDEQNRIISQPSGSGLG
jgi:aspartate 1-decarboxylase